MSDAYQKIILLLQNNNIDFKIFEHEPIITINDSCNSLPFNKDNLLKTLVFRVKNSYWVLVGVKVDDKIDFKKLTKNLNISRDSLKRPEGNEIETELGFQIGGIGPFPIKEDIKIVLDKKVEDLGVVYCGVGRNDRTLQVDVYELKKVCCPIIGDITQ